jgi:dihydrofolate reductase
MGKVVMGISMSLDGFVAGPNDGPDNPLGDGGERLFEWYFSGDTPFIIPGDVPEFKVSRASAEHLAESISAIGAMVAGRRMFDIANAWQGHPPGEGPCFIVTHFPPQEWVKEGSPFTFVTDGVESAIRQAKAAAGDKNVAVSSASIAKQCLKAGLLDEISIDLAPVLLGGGVRLFEYLGNEPIALEKNKVIDAPGVTHLGFRVVKD